jgi:hypothetical protein
MVVLRNEESSRRYCPARYAKKFDGTTKLRLRR